MKVGTDGVLLGAWAPLPQSGRILDVGTGTGLIALMAAQRSPDSGITAIDTDAQACEEAAENVQHSPWADRVTVIHISLQEYAGRSSGMFDLLISNPPYFSNSLLSPSGKRNLARHDVALGIHDILISARNLLKQSGSLALILPSTQYTVFREKATDCGFFEWRKMTVFPMDGKPAHRILSVWGMNPAIRVISEQLTIESHSRHSYTPEYLKLTHDFYL